MAEHFPIKDRLHDYYQITLSARKILHEEQSRYQHIQIAETEFFGGVLLLDGIIQFTEYDNAAYHEMISHVPLMACEAPERVMIVGGGDGGTLQQVLKHAQVQTAVVVELDRRVVELCEEYFPEFGEPFHDPRAKLVVEDAFPYLEQNAQQFDVIIADTTDPVGEAEKLFSSRFYGLMWAALRPGGVIVTQCEQMYFDADLIREMMGIARELSKQPAYYHALVPTYPGGGIGFLFVSDVSWRNGQGKAYPQGLRYLNREVHEAAFAHPQFLKEALGE